MAVVSSPSTRSSLRVRPATPADLAAILDILAQTDLPLDGVAENLPNTLVGELGPEIVATAGVEWSDTVGLLRSVAVRHAHQRGGCGADMVRATIGWARTRGLTDVYLLTTTAPAFFERLGFETVPRAAAPDTIRRTREFSAVCPDSAVLMHRSI